MGGDAGGMRRIFVRRGRVSRPERHRYGRHHGTCHLHLSAVRSIPRGVGFHTPQHSRACSRVCFCRKKDFYTVYPDRILPRHDDATVFACSARYGRSSDRHGERRPALRRGKRPVCAQRIRRRDRIVGAGHRQRAPFAERACVRRHLRRLDRLAVVGAGLFRKGVLRAGFGVGHRDGQRIRRVRTQTHKTVSRDQRQGHRDRRSADRRQQKRDHDAQGRRNVHQQRTSGSDVLHVQPPDRLSQKNH